MTQLNNLSFTSKQGVARGATSRLLGKIVQTPEILTIPVISAYQMHDSYNKADKREKNKTLLRNLFILASTATGILTSVAMTGKLILKSKHLKPIKPELIKTASIPIGGLVSGLIAGNIANNLLPIKYPPSDKKAEEKLTDKITNNYGEKSFVMDSLFKTLSIISLTLLSVIGGNALANKALKSKFATNQFKKINGDSAIKVAKKSFNIASMLAVGTIGNYISRKLLNSKQKTKQENEQKQDLTRILNDYDSFNNELSGVLGTTFSTLSGFTVGQEQAASEKLKKSFYEIISNVVIPSSIVIPTTFALTSKRPPRFIRKAKVNINKAINLMASKIPDKKLTSSLKEHLSDPNSREKIVKQSILFPVTITSLYLGHSLGEYFNKKVTEKITKTKMWNQLFQTRQNIVKTAMKGVSEQNHEMKQKAVADLAKIQKLEKALLEEL